MLNATIAQAAIAAHANNNVITAQQVTALLQNVHGVTFATVTQVTPVATAAKYKNVNIVKVTVANVQLFNNVKQFNNVYAAAVKRSAAQIVTNDTQNVQQFVTKETYYMHTACFSVVQHKTNGTQYLYCLLNNNNAKSAYYIDGQCVTKEQVAQYLSASAAKNLLNATNTIHNVTNNIEHTVKVFTPKLQNIVSIVAQKQTVQV
jgi:hypothetical protein